ncbi:beta-galactosidase [Arthrobacter tecti]
MTLNTNEVMAAQPATAHPTRLNVSGAMHYPRTHPGQWRARLEALCHMGLNTIETYVPWNLHEPKPGQYRFDGLADLERFLDLVAELGMDAIVRPGPYICAEWDNGGLPSWLTGRPGIRIRTADPNYLGAVDRWFDELIPRIASRQVTRGGNVTMVQVENEYGSYGSDEKYLVHLRDGLRRRGIDVPLFTSDGPEDHMLTGGTVNGAAATVNFGSKQVEAFSTLARHRPKDAPFCMEFWNGWFDHWGREHHTRDAGEVAEELNAMLSRGASVNFYMAHGGTNFGCSAGANHDGVFRPTVTSYDYDAPLDERGAPTEKYWQYREVIGRHVELPDTSAPQPAPVLPARRIELTERLDLRTVWESISTPPRNSPHTPTLEELGVEHGLVRYRARIPGPRKAYPLTLPGLADRAHVYVDGKLLITIYRDEAPAIDLAVPEGGVEVELIVESMGRVNYGPFIGESKGLVGGVLHGPQHVHGWDTSALVLPDLPAVPWERADNASDPAAAEGPSLLRGHLDVDEPADAFLDLEGWSKGYVWVNGFCLGRYWDRGPQRTLYLPGPVLVPGRNEVLVLELDGVDRPVVPVVGKADLGSTAKASSSE